MAARYPRRMMWKFAVLPGTRDRAAARASRSLATRYSPVFRSIATDLPRPRRPSRRATRLLIVARLTAECPMIGRRRSCLRVPVGARASDPLTLHALGEGQRGVGIGGRQDAFLNSSSGQKELAVPRDHRAAAVVLPGDDAHAGDAAPELEDLGARSGRRRTRRAQVIDAEMGRAIRSFRGRRRVFYDRKLEERFARDFRRVAPEWDVIREPEAVQAGGTLIFPDFVLRHRADRRRWLVEIVGFWTRDYVERKLALLRVAGLQDLVLCIDESRNCADGSLPSSSRIMRFRRRVDAMAVLHLIEHESAGAEPDTRGRGVPRRRG